MVNDTQQIIDIQMREGKDGYISLIMGHFSRMAYIVASGGDQTNKPADLYYMSNLIISMIPDLERQKVIRKKLKDRIEELKLSEKKSEGAAISTAAIEIVGDITYFMDEHLGVSKANRIAFDFDCTNCKFKKESEKIERTETECH